MKRSVSLTQIRMARAALNWSTARLAQEAGLPKTQLFRAMEAHTLPADMLVKVRTALEDVGIVFFAEGETVTGGAGVLLRVATVADPVQPAAPAIQVVRLTDTPIGDEKL